MKENEQIEYKRSISELKEGIISIVAILNKHKNGELYFGIDGRGNSTKQKVTEKTLRDISQAIGNNIEPKIYPEIKKEKDYIKISFSGEDSPYFAYGRAYIRVADEDRQLSVKELENMIFWKSSKKWDSNYSNINLNSINTDSLKDFIRKANDAGRIKFPYKIKENTLEKLDMMKDGKILNAAEMLFSKKKPLEMQAAIFAGKTRTNFIDIKKFEGNILELIEISKSYISQNIRWKADLSSNRVEIPEIPKRAFFEAIVNSYAHRNYCAPESNKIAIYSDRIVIWNPGNFPEGYKPEDFIKKEIFSILRNPLIAKGLYLSSEIERWASGLKRICDECLNSGIKVEFIDDGYGFSVIFYRKEEGPKRVLKKVLKELTNNQKKIIQEMGKDPRVTSEELAKIIGISPRKIRENITKLKEDGFVKRIGGRKEGYWKVFE